MGIRQPLLLAAVLLLPGLAPLAGAAQGDEHYLNVNQTIVTPGQSVAYSVSGRAGEVAFRVDRILDPASVRDFAFLDDAVRRETVLARTASLTTTSEQYYGGGERWGSMSGTFTPPGPGIYLVETARGDVTQRAWLQVTEHSWLAKTGPTAGIVQAFHLRDGTPLPGARVVVNGTDAGHTGPDGILALDPARLEGPILVYDAAGMVSAGDLDTVMPLYLSSYRGSWNSDQERQVLVHFDRPVYRPGHLVQMKAIALDAKGDRYVPATTGALNVRVTTYARDVEQVVHEETLKPNDMGSVAVSFRLSEDAAIGGYSVSVTSPEDHQGYAHFQVEAYKTPRIKVDVTTARDAYAVGDEVLVHAEAAWLFGAPLNRGQVRYTLQPTYYGGHPCIMCSRGFYVGGDGGVTPVNGDGTLRPDGTFTFSYTPERATWSTEIVATVVVTAESGEQTEGQAVFTVHPAAYTVQFEGGYHGSVKRATPVEVSATVRDHEGRAVPSVPVTFVLDQESGPGLSSIDAMTDARGRAIATFPAPSSGGGHHVIASVKDAKDRVARAETWLWIADERARWAGEGDLQVLPDRDAYAPGETARVLLLSSRPTSVLLTVEGSDLHHWTVVRVDGSAFVDVPITASYAPSVALVATAIRARADGTSNPDLLTREATLQVLPDPRVLNVTITPDKPVHRDGDDARVLVQVRNAQGHPVEGEMSLGIVDEGIYRLHPDNGASFADQLYGPRRAVQTYYAWWMLQGGSYRGAWMGAFDMMAAPQMASSAFSLEEAMDDGARTAFMPAVKVREDFPDTALWLPFLRTDANGTARVSLSAPDTLTEWRLTGRVHTADGLVGQGLGSFHTRKPLMVELSAPRFLVQGDALSINAVVFNHVGEMRDIEVQLVGVGAAQVEGAGYRRVTLSDGDSARIDFAIKATEDPSALANLTVVVRSTGDTEETDAMRLRIPVLPHGVVEKAVRAGTDDATLAIPLPPGPYAAQPALTVTLSPGMAGTVFDALPYLLGFPYGCVEQTMSRFMPAVVATRALGAVGYDTEDAQLPEYVDAGLARLMHFQHADGGWGWWESDPTHPYMTAYVVAGLAEARRADVKVDERAFDRGVSALQRLYVVEKEADMRAYHAYALALAGHAPEQWPAESEVSTDGLALLGLARLAAGDREEANAILDRLMEKAVREEGRLHWATEIDKWGFHGIRSDVQVSAHALRLLVGLDRTEDAPLVVSWLADQRTGPQWDTTKDTAESVLAIVDHLQTVDELNPDFDAVVHAAGETFTVPFHGSAKTLKAKTLTIPLPEGAEGADVRIEKEGAGRLYWTAVLAATPRAVAIEPLANGIRVDKRIVDDDGRDAPILRFNEEYTVILNVSTSAQRGHVLLRDALPAGVEVVKDDAQRYVPWMRIGPICWDCRGWGGPWSNVETRDDHVAAFATLLPSGMSTLSYRVRAVHPGSYHVLPATVEEMYAPQVHGRSGELHVAIGDVPRVLLADAVIETSALTLRIVGGAPELSTLVLAGTDGREIAAKAAPGWTLFEDGSATVHVATEAPLPDVFTVTLLAPDAPPVARTFDRTGETHRFGGTFSEVETAAWDDGTVMDARTAITRSEPAEPFERPADPRPVDARPVDPPAPPGRDGSDEEPPAPAPRGVPAPGVLATVAVLGLLGLVAARRRK